MIAMFTIDNYIKPLVCFFITLIPFQHIFANGDLIKFYSSETSYIFTILVLYGALLSMAIFDIMVKNHCKIKSNVHLIYMGLSICILCIAAIVINTYKNVPLYDIILYIGCATITTFVALIDVYEKIKNLYENMAEAGAS